MTEQAVYCLDTSSLIEGWRHYPPRIFPALWTGFEGLVSERRALAIELVRDELERKDDTVFRWSRELAGFYVPVDEATSRQVSAILARYPRLVDERRNRSAADPFVIRLTRIRGGVCVTEERRGNPRNIRIPHVCDALGVRWTNLLGMIETEGWTF